MNDDVSELDIDRAVARLSRLGVGAGALVWRINRSRDERKGRVIIEEATFVDLASFDLFTRSPEHRDVGISMSEIADWWVGDYETPLTSLEHPDG